MPSFQTPQVWLSDLKSGRFGLLAPGTTWSEVETFLLLRKSHELGYTVENSLTCQHLEVMFDRNTDLICRILVDLTLDPEPPEWVALLEARGMEGLMEQSLGSIQEVLLQHQIPFAVLEGVESGTGLQVFHSSVGVVMFFDDSGHLTDFEMVFSSDAASKESWEFLSVDRRSDRLARARKTAEQMVQMESLKDLGVPLWETLSDLKLAGPVRWMQHISFSVEGEMESMHGREECAHDHFKDGYGFDTTFDLQGRVLDWWAPDDVQIANGEVILTYRGDSIMKRETYRKHLLMLQEWFDCKENPPIRERETEHFYQQDRLVEKRHSTFDADSTSIQTEKFFYGPEGHLQEVHDVDGQRVEKRWYDSTGLEIRKTVVWLDEQGTPLDSYEWSYTYVKDEWGNWVKKLNQWGGISEERWIKYHHTQEAPPENT